MVKTSCQSAFVCILQPGKELRLDALHLIHFFGFANANEPEGEEGRYPGSIEDTRHECKKNRPWEELDKLTQRTGDNTGHREEHTTYRHRRERHRHEEQTGADIGCVPTRMMAIQIIGVTVNDNDRVIDDHTEHEDEGRQRDSIQFDTRDVHQSDTDRGADR